MHLQPGPVGLMRDTARYVRTREARLARLRFLTGVSHHAVTTPSLRCRPSARSIAGPQGVKSGIHHWPTATSTHAVINSSPRIGYVMERRGSGSGVRILDASATVYGKPWLSSCWHPLFHSRRDWLPGLSALAIHQACFLTPMPRSGDQATGPQQTGSASTVFVVDDEAALLDAVRIILETEGYEVHCFRTGQEFLDALDPTAFGCIILDLCLPDCSGLDIQDSLVERGIDIPHIFLTGYGSVPTSSKAFRSGALDFLEKPFDREVLLQRVAEALARAEDQRWRVLEGNGQEDGHQPPHGGSLSRSDHAEDGRRNAGTTDADGHTPVRSGRGRVRGLTAGDTSRPQPGAPPAIAPRSLRPLGGGRHAIDSRDTCPTRGYQVHQVPLQR